MTKYEYRAYTWSSLAFGQKKIPLHTETLNELGKEGWQAFAVTTEPITSFNTYTTLTFFLRREL